MTLNTLLNEPTGIKSDALSVSAMPGDAAFGIARFSLSNDQEVQ